MTSWARCSQIVAAPAGWHAVHADQDPARLDLDGPMSEIVTLRPIAAFALFADDGFGNSSSFTAIAARDWSYGGVPSGFQPEDEEGDFVGYLAPGVDLELFRGATEDHYEAKQKAREARVA